MSNDMVSKPLLDGPRTNKEVEMYDPVLFPPPLGEDLLLINPGGVLIKGKWTPDCQCWMHYPKIPQSVKARRRLTLLKDPK